MATSWAEIITNKGKCVIDDVRLDNLLAENPAQFFRKMALYMEMAIPLFNRPPEVREFLENGLVLAKYADQYWKSTEDSTQGATVVDTGLTGFELFSCSLLETDGANNAVYVPYDLAEYDSDTGRVTFPIQPSAGLTYSLDFYSDGQFAHDLTLTQKRILGMCFKSVWYEPIKNNWLDIIPKIGDRSFDNKAEAPHINAVTGRDRSERASLNAELRKYEQDVMYQQTIKRTLTSWV